VCAADPTSFGASREMPTEQPGHGGGEGAAGGDSSREGQEAAETLGAGADIAGPSREARGGEEAAAAAAEVPAAAAAAALARRCGMLERPARIAVCFAHKTQAPSAQDCVRALSTWLSTWLGAAAEYVLDAGAWRSRGDRWLQLCLSLPALAEHQYKLLRKMIDDNRAEHSTYAATSAEDLALALLVLWVLFALVTAIVTFRSVRRQDAIHRYAIKSPTVHLHHP
jgi:hypothetical protein